MWLVFSNSVPACCVLACVGRAAGVVVRLANGAGSLTDLAAAEGFDLGRCSVACCLSCLYVVLFGCDFEDVYLCLLARDKPAEKKGAFAVSAGGVQCTRLYKYVDMIDIK